MIIKSTPINRTPLLKTLLTERFPDINFQYKRFALQSLLSKRKSDRGHPNGVVAELKRFSEPQIKLFDKLCSHYKNVQIIFILSPRAYQILNNRRKKQLHDNMVVLSETKSLDYLAQLPRLIEGIIWKDKMRSANERLQRIMSNDSLIDDREFFDDLPMDLCDETATESLKGTGLRVRFGNWNRLKTNLNSGAQTEVASLLSRTISSAVRTSDRVLRSRENEFLIFLSNVNKPQIRKCTQRIVASLKTVKVKCNKRPLELSFSVKNVDELSYNV